jgi:hypothetical protein
VVGVVCGGLAQVVYKNLPKLDDSAIGAKVVTQVRSLPVVSSTSLEVAKERVEMKNLIFCIHTLKNDKDSVVIPNDTKGDPIVAKFILKQSTLLLQIEDEESILGALVFKHNGEVVGWDEKTYSTGFRGVTLEDFERDRDVLLKGPCKMVFAGLRPPQG